MRGEAKGGEGNASAQGMLFCETHSCPRTGFLIDVAW